ncbi:nudix hydrolase 9 isoform X3 [Solanum dulcamara]|uniref:nudix hydrolase 9 isoform X3 n=1 Tax=Solanum dulcamara TaxID=45834 RepID=UPI00248688C6|nr:nudix hydrolase 9 isoform X3 [Solanum dulcamara]
MEEKLSCNGGHEFKLLLSCPSGLSPSQVSVVFDEAYDRIPHPDPTLEQSISEYGGYNFDVGNDPKQQLHVSLHLGLTDYRTFVGTNLSLMWERFLVPSEDDCIQCQHTSSPLGNGAVVETSDGRILVLQRSNKVGEFPGYFVFPGGHPEPQEVGIISHEGFQELNQCHMINSKVSQEMFDSIVREVVEEIGAPANSLSSPIFIGISRRVLNVRPTAFFFIKCNLLSDEIQQLYSSAQDGFESTQLYAVSMSDLENMASKMPGCHRGGYALYKLMVQGTSDS